MEPKVVKRGGRPNRGGGRFNRGGGPGGRGRGGQGRGRGRGRGAPGPGPGRGQTATVHRGHGGRKGGADLLYDDYGDDYDEPMRGPNFQGNSVVDDDLPREPQYVQPTPQQTFPKRRSPVKVAMQQLNMSTENQAMVKDMLRNLHGEELQLGGEDEYDELDHRGINQYWMTSNQLKVEGASSYAADVDSEAGYEDVTVSTLAVNKLSRYGFHKARCSEALQLCDGDVGLALEYLLSECFGLQSQTLLDKVADPVNEEILEQRLDEKLALQSIYEDKFVERVENRVWIVKLALPHLVKLSCPPRKERKKVQTPDKNVCRLFKQGSCRFGNKCKFKHVAPVANVVEDSPAAAEPDLSFEVEVRFPKGNRYPFEPAFVAFSTTGRVPYHVCLNITKHLMNEAKSAADMHEPCVFTVINSLEDESLLERIVKQPLHDFSAFSKDKPWKRESSMRDVDGMGSSQGDIDTDKQGTDLSDQTAAMIRMVDKEVEKLDPVPVKRSSSRDEDIVRRISPAELLKQNRRIVDEYKRKKLQSNYKAMQVVRQKLPAWDKQDDVMRTIEDNQVVVISGMTGCGKTTQVPQFILDQYLNSGDLHLCNILCTQPRRISAMAVAERVSEERADKLGRTVGYQIRLEKMQSSMTRLLFCTTGIVLRRLEADPTLDGVTHLIIDEVHERSEDSDFLLMYLRDMLPRRPDLKVILMSATLNADLFCGYFFDCPAVNIPGRTFPVEQYFLEDVVEFTRFIMEENSPYARPVKFMNAVQRGLLPEEMGEEEEASQGASHPASNRIQDQNLSVKQLFLRYTGYRKQTVKSLAMMDHTKINFDLVVDLLEFIVSGDHKEDEFPSDGAILIFMPGYAEIQTLFDLLQSSSVFGSRNKHRYRIIPLHSTLSSEDQHAVFSRPKEGVTKIVISTNIAETSITIDDVVFVVDCGKMKEKRYDPTKGMESLEMVWVSKANALQRRGRAGRVKSGVCFHLFTSHRYQHHLQAQPIPEIQRAPLEQIVLRIRMLDIFKTVRVQSVLDQLPEPPEREAITAAIKRLQDLGALDQAGELTPLGYHLGSLPVDVRIGKLMLFGAIFRCLDSALTIAACLSFKSPFVSPFGKKHEATEKKVEFAAGNSDHLTMVNAYKAWTEARKKSYYAASNFCQENFLSQRSLQMLASMKQQFVELLSDIGFVREGISARDVERAARSGGDGVSAITGEEANVNCKNWKLVSAILVGALYPNVVQVLTPESKYTASSAGSMPKVPKAEELRFKTKVDGYVNIHPSSVNFQVRYYDSPYLVYHEKVKTSKIYIRDCTMVSVYPLLLFGGGQIAVDLSRGNFILSVDEGWIRFMAQSHEIAELVREVRLELDQLLADKIENPHLDLCLCPRGSRIIDTIVQLVTTQ